MNGEENTFPHPMSNRLLSLLSEIEHAIKANDSNPDGGTWETLRIVNFHQGLARLNLAVRSGAGTAAKRGAILLQGFTLADGAEAVKSSLSWHGSENIESYSAYSKPEVNWHSQANQIATKWLDGCLAMAEAQELAHGQPASPMELPPGQAAAPLEKATG